MEEPLVAKLALGDANYAIDKPYDYLVPDVMAERAAVGMRALAPFGRGNRRSEGLILSLSRGARRAGLKGITALLDEEPVLDEAGIRLAIWMRERCFCTLYEAAKAMLPAGLWFSLRDVYRVSDALTREEAFAAVGRSEACAAVLEYLYASGGLAEHGKLCAALGAFNPAPALRILRERGLVVLETSAVRGVKDKLERYAELALPADEVRERLAGKQKTAPLRCAVAALLMEAGRTSVKDICYYTGASGATLSGMEKSGLIITSHEPALRRPEFERTPPAPPVSLNETQQAAFDGLSALCAAGAPSVALLCGVTGSGKTSVYLRLVETVLSRGKTAIVLVPEISLTPQLLRQFHAQFGEKVAVLHSSLRPSERCDEWKRLRKGDACVALGTRSAVFAPCRNLGLIILDEEQEHTYKSENNPRYHARDVAKYRCVQDRALLLLGSATPSVESMYHAERGVYHLFSLPHRYQDRPLPQVMISDMRQELLAGNGGNLGETLVRELTLNLERGEQSILFLNRRGNSPMVICGECGETPTCCRCSVRLTYHSANKRLICHYCGHSEPMPDACPACGGILRLLGAGTQRIEEELRTRFPGVEILRMDADTLSATRAHETILSRFEKRRIPMLVGTQVVTKGLDFENVTLVGVVAADLSLYVDDYRAGERTFSLITQVVGRAGRGGKSGRAVIQTYTPKNEVILTAARQDYFSFYRTELELRRIQRAAPFADRFVLTVSGREEVATLRAAARLRGWMEEAMRLPRHEMETRLLGPAPAAVVKVKEFYRYRLTLCGKNDSPTRALLSRAVIDFRGDRRNRGLTVYADLDPEGG